MSDIWNDNPVQTETEGVEEANPPATPSEVVEPSTETETVDTDVVKSASDSEQAAEQTTEPQSETPSETPDVKREARKVYMETQKLGGFDALKEAYDLQTAIQDHSLDAKTKLEKLYQTAPRAYEDIKKELFFSYWDDPAQQESLIQERFGVSADEIQQVLANRGQVAPSPTTTAPPSRPATVPTEEEIGLLTNEELVQRFKAVQTALPADVQAELQRLKDLEKKFPELETKVNSFTEAQETAQKEKVVQLGNEFVQEAMQPVVKLMEEAGLKALPDDSPEEKAWKDEVWDTIMTKTYNDLLNSEANAPLAKDIETFITKLDRTSAWGKMRLAQAKAEQSAAKRIPIYTSQRQAQRDSQTSVLGKDRPPVITGGQGSFGSEQNLPTGRDTWNDPAEAERWKDIAASIR